MKIKIHPQDPIVLEVPEYVFNAYNEHHMMNMLNAYIKETMMSDQWYLVNVGDVTEVRIAYKRRRKGLDRLDAETERGNLIRTDR